MTLLAEKLLTPAEFEEVMVYFPTRKGDSRDIAFNFYVLGQPATAISATFQCTKQNTIKAISRFASALERYHQAKRNLARASAPARAAKAAHGGPDIDASAVQPAAAQPATKKAPRVVAAKKAAAVAPAAKKAAASATKRPASAKTAVKTAPATSPASKKAVVKRVR